MLWVLDLWIVSDCNRKVDTVFENLRKSLIQLYIYFLSEQKFIKKAKNGAIWQVFENLNLLVKQCYQTGQFLLDKNWGKCQNWKLKCDILIGQKVINNAKKFGESY